MSTQFAHDLRLARRKAGYTQGDVAHLLDVHQSKVSDLENGREAPDLEEIMTLSLIYGRSFESFFSAIMCRVRNQLSERVNTLPDHVRRYAGTFNRDGSLQRLRNRLAEDTSEHGDH